MKYHSTHPELSGFWGFQDMQSRAIKILTSFMDETEQCLFIGQKVFHKTKG